MARGEYVRVMTCLKSSLRLIVSRTWDTYVVKEGDYSPSSE